MSLNDMYFDGLKLNWFEPFIYKNSVYLYNFV